MVMPVVVGAGALRCASGYPAALLPQLLGGAGPGLVIGKHESLMARTHVVDD